MGIQVVNSQRNEKSGNYNTLEKTQFYSNRGSQHIIIRTICSCSSSTTSTKDVLTSISTNRDDAPSNERTNTKNYPSNATKPNCIKKGPKG